MVVGYYTKASGVFTSMGRRRENDLDGAVSDDAHVDTKRRDVSHHGIQFDANGRMTTVTSGGGTFATATYTAAGQLYAFLRRADGDARLQQHDAADHAVGARLPEHDVQLFGDAE
jgi:YD repeat-containing protein